MGSLSGRPPPRGQTDACENITLPQTSFASGKIYGKSQRILSVRKSGDHVVITLTDERDLRGELPEHDPTRPGDRFHGRQRAGGAGAPGRPLHPGRDGPRLQLLPEAEASQQSHPQVCRSCRLNRVILRYVGPGTSIQSS